MTESTAALAPAVRETHVSVLFFVGDRAYKLKKPVQLDFLDLSRRADRERACEREVELNRRLAPDVYLGVSDVLGTDGSPCDHLVVMQRMPEGRRLSTLVRQQEASDECIRDVARVIAGFHSRVETSPEIASAGTVESVLSNWESNFATMQPFVGATLDPDDAARVETLSRRYLAGRGPLFAERIAHGKVRDGHGDLLADDIFCLDDGPRVLDCIEFDDRLRHGDVLADVAFLAMDLERVGAPELGRRFLGWYREFSGETYPMTLAHHYIAYRAHVRSKVACLRMGQGDAAAAADAARLLAIARDHLERGRVTLTLVGGLPGTGKSTLATDLADRLGWTILRSDEIRKDLAGLGHTTRRDDAFGEGLYDEGSTDHTYAALLERARSLLALGEPVILDASWNASRRRDAARAVADATASEILEIRCDAPAEIVSARLARRLASGTDASDATGAIAARMATTTDPWPTAATVDTSSSREHATAAAMTLLHRAPDSRPSAVAHSSMHAEESS